MRSDLFRRYCRQAHTHGHPRLTLAAAEAAGRYGHVLFPSGTHAPALQLAEKLLDSVGKGWAERVFYSDNGSTGMEVALKMALRSSGKRYGWEGVVGEDVGVIGLKGGYHGDTVSSCSCKALQSNRADLKTYFRSVRWMHRIKGFTTRRWIGTRVVDSGSRHLKSRFRTGASS